mmetsp:Transcript_46288/g.90374  ORF Transcript_46288/g.90374 Transcript_46288/m.90374 type:complete len:213 (+) Transcript_46288:1074-1712(+)
MDAMGVPVRTAPPRAVMCSTRGWQRRSGWFPSRKAVCDPSASLMKRFMAVRITLMLSLSGSVKSSALPMATKISSLIRSGMPYFFINSTTLSSSWASMKDCPSSSIGRRPGTIRSFSSRVSISVFVRIAAAMLKGAGTPAGNSKDVNRPGSSCIANVMRCSFHCSRSSISSSSNRFIMWGYAPKKMCRPVSIQSPSSSCHADTLPPRTPRAS